ncbi:MAG: DNA ligase [Pseudomonadota bacterium]
MKARGLRTLCAAVAWLLFGTEVSAASAAPPPLMLAQTYGGQADVSAYWVSEKLDGVRGYWDGQRLYSRSGQAIVTPVWFTAGWPTVPLDGELWIGRGRFDETSGIVRSKDGDPQRWRLMRYMVFDLPAHPGRFSERLVELRHLVGSASVKSLQAVDQFRLPDAAALQARLAAIVAAGGEGLMLQRADAYYRGQRSDDLLKLKTHDDAEARVIGYAPGNGKYRGVVGALIVERPDGRRFRIGSGLTDALRQEPPPLGSWVTYRYNGSTGDGLPRFPRYVRVREDMPPPDPP